MKRFISCFLLAIILMNILPVFCMAKEGTEETIFFEDGSYMIIEIVTNGSKASGSVTGNKRYTYYNDSNVTQWQAVLTGTFTYTGYSSTCTSSSVNVSIYDSTWYVSSKYASKSGNTATASVTMGKTLEGITMTKVPVNLTLSCDANGNLS